MAESEFVSHEPCPNCGSSDANSVFSDGHTYCFACEHYTPGDAEDTDEKPNRHVKGLLPVGDYIALTKRKLDEESCRKWGYSVSKWNGKSVQVANYRDPVTGGIIGQKVRTPDKEFVTRGDMKKPPLYGQNLWRDGGRRVVVTEGEVDAITVSQLQDHRWPVVSLPTGAKGARKALERNLEWLDKFQEVVLLFDNDEPGQAAAADCAPLFAPGKCKVARLPLKDANEMLLAGRGDEVISAIWEAKTYRPDGIVTIADIRERVLSPPKQGLPWWTDTLTKLTFGRQWGSIYAFGAGTGIGKTDFLTQQMEYDIDVLGLPVGVFALEQRPEETVKRIAGKFAGKTFHIPDGSWKKEDLEATLDTLEAGGKLFMYDNFGAMDWDIIRSTMRHLAHNDGVRIFYIDNLTALAAMADDEKKMLEKTMAELAGITNELGAIVHLVSHLSTPEGTPHEEGGRVMIRHFKGSRTIGYWCQFMFGMERDTQAEDKAVRTTTTFRVLKDRFTGRSSGEVFYLGYDAATAKLYETEKPQEASAYGFSKEEATANTDF